MTDDTSSTELLPETDAAEQEAAIAALFEDYRAGFNDFDAETILDCFAFPATIWQFGKGYVFQDEEELAENIDMLLAAVDKEGVTYSEYATVACHISGTAALVTLDWNQQGEDGDTVLAFTCHYHLIRDDDEWLISTIVNEAP